MAEHGHHCPFLNRADARCSTHFQLNHLGSAFEHCLDHYRECTVYAELLDERQRRRAPAGAGGTRSGFWARGPVGAYDAASIGAADGDSSSATTTAAPSRTGAPTACTARPPRCAIYTPLTVANRNAQPTPDGAGVPPVPGI
jgi:hypothetical protein